MKKGQSNRLSSQQTKGQGPISIFHEDAQVHDKAVFNTQTVVMDKLAEEKKLQPLLNDILSQDEPLYGVDEILALSIVNVYGSIGFTNYGYIDKVKPGILKNLDDKSTGKVNIFLDDLVGAIAAAAASRLAHSIPAKEELD